MWIRKLKRDGIMSFLSKYFNAQAAAPSWRLAKVAAVAFAAATIPAVFGSPVVADISSWAALSSVFVSVAAWANGVRKGFSLRSRAPSPSL